MHPLPALGHVLAPSILLYPQQMARVLWRSVLNNPPRLQHGRVVIMVAFARREMQVLVVFVQDGDLPAGALS